MKDILKYTIRMILIILIATGCQDRFNCDASDNENLGPTDYTDQFNEWNIETTSESIRFYSSTDSIILQRNNELELEPHWLIDHTICKSIDIKPTIAYAYYEYENKSTLFSNDEKIIQLNIEPFIAIENEVRTESIFITLSNSMNSIKAKVPITNIASIVPEGPFGYLFDYHESLIVEGQTLYDVWSYTDNGLSIYYNKDEGIVGINSAGYTYFRLR